MFSWRSLISGILAVGGFSLLAWVAFKVAFIKGWWLLGYCLGALLVLLAGMMASSGNAADIKAQFEAYKVKVDEKIQTEAKKLYEQYVQQSVPLPNLRPNPSQVYP